MREIITEIIIDADIEKIWSVLLDFKSYSIWNPFIRSIEGTNKEGEEIKVTIQPLNKKPMIFKPHILSISKYEFIWLGKAWNMFNIFCGEHRFLLQPINSKQVKLIHSEIFSGLLHIPIFSLIYQSTKSGFINMNEALKKRCEV